MMLSIGEFAKKTGLTVRALRFYEEKGLISPPRSRDNDRRFYGEREFQEIQKILGLKQLGFPLTEIEDLIRGKSASLPKVLTAQLEALEADKAKVDAAIKSLKSAIAALKDGNDLDIQTLTKLIRMTTMTETAKKDMKKVYQTYFTEDQLKELETRKPPEEQQQAYNQKWCDLMRRGEAMLDEGVEPSDPRAQALAKEAEGLVEIFTGGNQEIHENLSHMYSDLDAWGDKLEALMKMDLETFKKVQAFLGEAAKAAC